MNASQKLSGVFGSEAALRHLQLIAGGAAIGLIFWRLQFSTKSICCGDFDGYYHIMWSRMLWEGIRSRHFPPLFTWLPLTTLSPKNYVDHHFLFHIFQIPFTWLRDLRLGAKIASTIFASLAVFSCYWFLVYHRIRYVLVWLVALLACSAPFLYRLNMAKAPPFAIIYLIIGIYLLFRRKYWPLLPLAFIFTLTYDMFVLLIVAAFVWGVVIGWAERRIEWWPVVLVLLGTAAGLVINPYFPHNLYLLYEHLKIKLTFSDFSTKVGQEWYPYETWEFLGNSLVACIAMVVGYIAFDPADRKRSHYPLFFLILSTALMVMTARWKRIAEYWPPFAILFAAFALQPWIDGARSAFTSLPKDILDELEPFLDRHEPAEAAGVEQRKELVRTLAAAVVVVALGIALFFNLRATTKDIANSEPADHYKAGMQWVRANVPPGEIVFNTDWDDFPRMFYFDPTHRYVSGLDPTYLYDRNPELSKLYDQITLGDEEDPGPLIRERFGAHYVFTDTSHQDFYNNAVNSGWFEVVHEEKDCIVLRLREQKVEPPPEQNDNDNSDSGDAGNDNGRPK
jgi:hypothetical protein